MKKAGIRIILSLLVICLIFPVLYIRAEDSGVKISVSHTGEAQIGQEIKLILSVGKPNKSLAGLEFNLVFDSAFVTPKITQNTEEAKEMDALIKKMPQGWEQMCSFSSNLSKYYFRFAMPENESVFLTGQAEIVLEIPFIVKAAGVAAFSVSDEDIIAVGADNKFSIMSGKGGSYSVATSVPNEKFSVNLGKNQTATEGGIYYLDIDVTNIGDNSGIIGFEFSVKYDPNTVKPSITKNDNNQMDVFMVDMPQSSWEQMCTLYESESIITLRFAALHAESITDSEILALNATAKISVPFTVVGKAGSKAIFSVDSATVIGINNKTQDIIGRGGTKNITIGQSTVIVPQGMYEIKSNHLLYVAEKTKISDFLEPFDNVYLTRNGARITEGDVFTGDIITNGKESITIVVKGDVNSNGKIDVADYMLIKRTYFGSYSPNTTQLFAMTFKGGSKPTTIEYILIKRHYFGTYDINK